MLHTHASPPLSAFRPTRAALGPTIVALGPRNGQSIVRAARALAARSPAGVIAVTAHEPLPIVAFGGEVGIVAPQFDERAAVSELDHLAARIHPSRTVDETWESRLLLGDPARAIAELARETNAPLVIMGLGRHAPLDRLLGRETTLRTIRQSPCPVLAVAHSASAPMRRVIVATDFSARSARAAEAAIPLLADDAVLHVVHVWERWELALEGVGSSTTSQNELYVRGLPERFQRFIDSLALPPGVKASRETMIGRPATEILKYAEEIRADLIVAGRHGRGQLMSMLAGSVTSAILRGAQCSVLVTPEPSYADVDRLARLITGASESSDPAEWSVQLEAFTRRNHGRATIVEEDDLRLGAQTLERGYRLLGAAYDPRARRVELMLGGAGTDEAYVTHRIGEVDFVSVASDECGRDIALSVQHGRGQTVLTFMPSTLASRS